MDLDLMLGAIDVIHEVFDEINDLQMILSVVGTAFDEWCAKHGMTSEETCEALRNLVDVQEQVHSMMGPADYINQTKSNGYIM
jgi:hypothetical protein